MDDLVRMGSLDAAMSSLLHHAVRERCNILISGGTSSGKTSLLNAMAVFIPESERVVTIEDAAELSLPTRMWYAWKPACRTGRAGDRVRAICCATACACGPTASSSVKCAAPRCWRCCRP
jgi:energy-coupling factor transporter ATP-binding protein EcfA2